MTVPTPAGFAAPPPPPAPALAMRSAATATAPPPPAPSVATSENPTCPNCGAEVSPRAIMCVKCGTNLKTGQKMARPGMPAAGIKPQRAPAGPSVWYKTPYPYLGGYLLILALTYFLAPGNPLMQLAFAGWLLMFLLGTWIATAVFAFKDDGAGKGFLCLCIGIYAIYYVAKVSERQFLKIVYGVAFLLGLAVKFGAFDHVFEKGAP